MNIEEKRNKVEEISHIKVCDGVDINILYKDQGINIGIANNQDGFTDNINGAGFWHFSEVSDSAAKKLRDALIELYPIATPIRKRR